MDHRNSIIRMFDLAASLCFISWLTIVHPKTLDDAYRFHDHLFNQTRYKADVRPIFNQSRPIKVHITQILAAVENVDVSHGTIATTGYLQLTWRDEVLVWDPGVFGNILTTHLPPGTYWRPELELYTTAEDNQGFGAPENSLSFLSYTGTVMMFMNANLKTRCYMDTFLFPFDYHRCTFYFLMSKYNSEEVLLESTSPYIHILASAYTENYEWELVCNDSTTLVAYDADSAFSAAGFRSNLLIKRRPVFLILHYVLPSCLLMCLNLITGFVPLNSGERLTYAITLSLAFVFLINTMTENIPSNSKSTSIASYFIVFINVTNCFTVGWSVLCLKMASLHTDDDKIPDIARKIVLWKRNSNKRKPKDTGSSVPEAYCITCDVYENQVQGDISSNRNDDIKNKPIEKEEATRRDDHAQDVTWAEVANALDRLYFKLLLTAVVLAFTALVIVVLTKMSV